MRGLPFLSAVAFAASIACASAQSAPPPLTGDAAAAAQELVAAVSSTLSAQLSAQTLAQAWAPLEEALKKQYPNMNAATLADAKQELQRQALSSIAAMMKNAPAIYGKYFTVPEMQALTAFYRTPAGLKLLQTAPNVSSDLMAAMTPQMQNMQERVSLALLNTLQRHGYYAR